MIQPRGFLHYVWQKLPMSAHSPRRKIVVLSGAGISAESGLATFRDSGGLWDRYSIEDVASLDGWARDPRLVLDFYNQRRAQAAAAQPNAAHRALARLEAKHEVVIITQNVDDLHERAGSTRVLHLHGELRKARSSVDESLVLDIGARPIAYGEKAPDGSQLRPAIVWFGEDVPLMEEALLEMETAEAVLVVGTSLQVYPAAGLTRYAPYGAERVLVTLDIEYPPPGYEHLRARATEAVPALVERWLAP